MPNQQRIDEAVDLLSGDPAYCLATIYLSEVDTSGHYYGPESAETRAAVKRVDALIARLIERMKRRGLWGRANLVIVSDHGMASTPISQRVAFEDYIDPATIEFIEGSPFFGMSARDGNQPALVEKLNRIPHLHACLARDVPERWHFQGSSRIAPVVALAEEGWTFDTRERMAHWKDPHLGNHGFDNDLESMRAIFLASGPAFKGGSLLPVFENVNVYALLAELLRLKPAANDGSLQVFLPGLVNTAN
jgi:predicted AlkP superfamily pyrophosphatase or phosphodiesterase